MEVVSVLYRSKETCMMNVCIINREGRIVRDDCPINPDRSIKDLHSGGVYINDSLMTWSLAFMWAKLLKTMAFSRPDTFKLDLEGEAPMDIISLTYIGSHNADSIEPAMERPSNGALLTVNGCNSRLDGFFNPLLARYGPLLEDMGHEVNYVEKYPINIEYNVTRSEVHIFSRDIEGNNDRLLFSIQEVDELPTSVYPHAIRYHIEEFYGDEIEDMLHQEYAVEGN